MFTLAYRTEEGEPYVLPVVREAELKLANDSSQNHEYLPVLGYQPFIDAALELLLGKDSLVIKEGRVSFTSIFIFNFLLIRQEVSHDILLFSS